MLKELKLQDIARNLGAELCDYQQVIQFGAVELQNIIYEIAGNNQQNVCKEIWIGYMKQSEVYES